MKDYEVFLLVYTWCGKQTVLESGTVSFCTYQKSILSKDKVMYPGLMQVRSEKGYVNGPKILRDENGCPKG